MTLRQSYRTSIDGYIAEHKLSCGLGRDFGDMERSRVKASLPSNNHANAPDCLTAKAEQPMNITVFDRRFTAPTPQGEF